MPAFGSTRPVFVRVAAAALLASAVATAGAAPDAPLLAAARAAEPAVIADLQEWCASNRAAPTSPAWRRWPTTSRRA